MLSLTLAIGARRHPEILCVGAHCDDIEIGCGGALTLLQRRYPKSRIHWLVLTSVDARRMEGVASYKKFVRPSCRGELVVAEFPDARLPAHFDAVKNQFEMIRKITKPDLVLTHHGLDRHQDHALASQLSWQTFRDHMIWEYEIPKYDGDLATPNMYVPLSRSAALWKAQTIVRAFPTQHGKTWFTADNLLAMMRVRGIESRSPSGFAEAFHCRKLVCELAKSDSASAAATRRQR